MLQAKDLMINDWVYSASNSPRKVECLDRYKSDSIGVAGYLNFEKNISPIPLSKEILLKNGFENIEGNLYRSGIIQIGLAMPRINIPHSLVYIFSAEEGKASIQMVCCDYVHTLQHVLRLYGLEEFADNFKV